MLNPSDAWKPYVATPDDPWDLAKVAHLHRRAGFGATWQELERDKAAGPAASIARLVDPPEPSADFERISDALFDAAGGNRLDSGYTGPNDALKAVAWWLYRMTYGPDPLGEKLTLFWHNHFATSLRGVYSVPFMLRQNQLFRGLARDNFAQLLTAIEADPAMLVWLDGGRNYREHPNENFARELLELFTLGVGPFTEADIRAAALALTGWLYERNSASPPTRIYRYDPARGDASEKTFLGQSGPWQTPDILRIILEHPATARHLCRKLYRWLVDESTEPSDELIEPLAEEYRASHYSTRHVVGIILRSRLFYHPSIYRYRVKSPVEYCVGVIRQLGPARSPNLLNVTALSCERQGQKLLDPPSVKGWAGGRAWLNTSAILERAEWTSRLLGGDPERGIPPYKSGNDAEENAPHQQLDGWVELLVDGHLSDATRAATKRLVESAEPQTVRQALLLLLQSPEYQLA